MKRDLKEEMPLTFEIPVEEMVEVVGSAFGIEKGRFYSLSRNREGARGRAVVANLGRKLAKYRVKELADYFRRDSVVISQGLERVEKKLRESEEFEKELEPLEQNLTRGKRHQYLCPISFSTRWGVTRF